MINQYSNLKKHITTHKFLILSIILGIVVSSITIGNKDLFLDEAASIAITHDWPSMLSKLWLFEGNMWFYYVLLFFWSQIGTGQVLLRSFSLIWAVLTLIPLYFLTIRLFNKNIAIYTVLLLPINVLFIKNAQYVRGYSLLLFLTTFSSYIFIRLTEKYSHKLILLYVALNVMAIYTHLFAIFIVAAHFLYILYLRRSTLIKQFLVSDIITALLILPLALAPSFKSGQINWITKPDVFDVGATFVFLTNDFVPVSLLCFIIFIIVFLSNKKSLIKQPSYVFLTIWIAFPIIICFLFSQFLKPIYNFQYFTICLIPMTIVVADMLTRFKKRRVTYILLSLIVLGSFIRLFYWYNETQLPYTLIKNQTAAWKDTADYIAIHGSKNDSIVILPTYTQIVFDYYYDKKEKIGINEIPLQPVNLASGYNSALNLDLLTKLPSKNSTLWLINEEDLTTDMDIKNKIINTIQNKYKTGNNTYFFQIKITKYEN